MQGDLLVVRTNFQINRGDYGIKQGENLDKVSDVIDISLALAGSAPKK
jgi:polyisoprenoid-binding protein YceI